jgi:hypothetical protein
LIELNEADRKIYGIRAQEILHDQVFLAAIDEARTTALLQLVKVAAVDVDKVLELQATVRGIERVKDALQNFVLNSPRAGVKVV